MHKQNYQVNRVEIWKNVGETWFENWKISTCQANARVIAAHLTRPKTPSATKLQS